MKVTYTNTFWELYVAQLKAYFRNRFQSAIGMTVVIYAASGGFNIDFIAQKPALFLYRFVDWAVFWVFLIAFILFITQIWNNFKHSAVSLYGPHTIEVTDSKLIEETTDNRSEYRAESIVKTYFDWNMIMLYVGASSFFVIPRRAFENTGEYQHFRTRLRELKYAGASNPPTNTDEAR
ncbi:MAG: YcxB family protein [Gammaproteobacteria bacterium]|jgi:hypothetical protein